MGGKYQPPHMRRSLPGLGVGTDDTAPWASARPIRTASPTRELNLTPRQNLYEGSDAPSSPASYDELVTRVWAQVKAAMLGYPDEDNREFRDKLFA